MMEITFLMPTRHALKLQLNVFRIPGIFKPIKLRKWSRFKLHSQTLQFCLFATSIQAICYKACQMLVKVVSALNSNDLFDLSEKTKNTIADFESGNIGKCLHDNSCAIKR